MGMFDRFIKTSKRSLENPSAPVSANDFLHVMGWGNYSAASGITVNTDNALGVPAVWAAVNFISALWHLCLWRYTGVMTWAMSGSGTALALGLIAL